jgi:hypothetical protein
MDELKNLETKFRIGATHASNWMRNVVKEMAAEGKTPQEISDYLGDLNQVLLDWRINWTNPRLNLPHGTNPWQWPKADLAAFIAERKKQW